MINQENINFTFLTDEQIFGPNQLDILKKYGTKCAITDFSILLGGYVSKIFYSSEGEELANRTGWWWTKSLCERHNQRLIITSEGDTTHHHVFDRAGGARPVLPYSLISSFSSNRTKGNDEILEVEYGEYPQDIVKEDLDRSLEIAYSNRAITKTGKSYTTDSAVINNAPLIERGIIPFKAKNHIEYEYNGKKYIRIIADSNCNGKNLSDGRIIQVDKAYWIEVKPIKWMIDEKTNTALPKKIIFSGIRFNDVIEFMNKYFIKDIMPSFSKEIKPTEKKQIEPNQIEKQIPNTPIEEIIDRILDNPREFYINIANELSIEEREYIKANIKNKRCNNCSNGTCTVETNEKHTDDACVAWDNKELIGRQKILHQNNSIQITK